jgi:hypothetical protein
MLTKGNTGAIFGIRRYLMTMGRGLSASKLSVFCFPRPIFGVAEYSVLLKHDLPEEVAPPLVVSQTRK